MIKEIKLASGKPITLFSPLALLKMALAEKGLPFPQHPKEIADTELLASDPIGRWPVTHDLVNILLSQGANSRPVVGTEVRTYVSAMIDKKEELGVTLFGAAVGTNVPCDKLFKACVAWRGSELPKVAHELARTQDSSLLIHWHELALPGLSSVNRAFESFLGYLSPEETERGMKIAKLLPSPFTPAPSRYAHGAPNFFIHPDDQHAIFAEWQGQLHKYEKEVSALT